MKVPFVDLKAQYNNIKHELDSAIFDVIENASFIKGRYVEEFENAFALKCGIKHCIGVANGTDAIYIALKMLGIGPGDEVITVANSWISTSETISLTGATPVFVDIEEDHYTIDPNKIGEKITKRTKAIIPVHLYGQPADMDGINITLEDAGWLPEGEGTFVNNKTGQKIYLIEDCAQAHFAEFKGKKIGTFGVAATFSFYPGKNLGAYGDAGAIITNDDELAKKMRMFANHGALKKHFHEIEGINSRLDSLQAAILNVKLKYIDEWNNERYKNALLYNKYLQGHNNIKLPKIRENCKHIFHIYVVRVWGRQALMKKLNESGIETAIHYPTILPLLNAYKYLNHKPEDFPIAHKYQLEILSLPMYPELTENQISYVAEEINKY